MTDLSNVSMADLVKAMTDRVGLGCSVEIGGVKVTVNAVNSRGQTREEAEREIIASTYCDSCKHPKSYHPSSAHGCTMSAFSSRNNAPCTCPREFVWVGGPVGWTEHFNIFDNAPEKHEHPDWKKALEISLEAVKGISHTPTLVHEPTVFCDRCDDVHPIDQCPMENPR